jgi:hypothetical protein
VFCIAAFIVLLFMAAISARYRRYLKAAAGCTFRRVTFRKCDTTFKQDVKDRMLAPIAARNPALVRPASITIEVLAVLVVLTTIWSGFLVVQSGLNLYVYGTCNKQDSASCSLGAQSCSIPNATPTFTESLGKFDLVDAFGNELSSVGDTIGAIPARFKTWKAADYLPANATYLEKYDPSKPTALEIVDPGCEYCKQLFENIEKAGFANKENLAYIAYPIASTTGYKFTNSLLVTQYLEALQLNPLAGAKTPVDWQILSRIYAGNTPDGVPWQSRINGMGHAATASLLQGWMAEFGMSPAQIATVTTVAASDKVTGIIAANKKIVEDRINTVKIPTIMFDGHRHDGLVAVNDLK